MRLIDADAFRREIDNHWPFTKEEQSKHGIADMAKGTLLYILNCMPTIESERKKGKWIKEDRGHVEYTGVCSECGFPWIWYDTREYFNFCPNCGLYMREDQDGKSN